MIVITTLKLTRMSVPAKTKWMWQHSVWLITTLLLSLKRYQTIIFILVTVTHNAPTITFIIDCYPWYKGVREKNVIRQVYRTIWSGDWESTMDPNTRRGFHRRLLNAHKAVIKISSNSLDTWDYTILVTKTETQYPHFEHPKKASTEPFCHHPFCPLGNTPWPLGVYEQVRSFASHVSL